MLRQYNNDTVEYHISNIRQRVGSEMHQPQ